MDIASELERSRLLGTARPTDDEIQEAFGELADRAEAPCSLCEDAHNAAGSLGDVTANDAETLLQRLIAHCGFSEMTAARVAKSFVGTIKASAKAA